MTSDEMRESAAYHELKGALHTAKQCRDAASEIDRLAARVAELEKDARRLDAIPKLADGLGMAQFSHTTSGVVFIYDFAGDNFASGLNVRTAIDAAIAALDKP